MECECAETCYRAKYCGQPEDCAMRDAAKSCPWSGKDVDPLRHNLRHNLGAPDGFKRCPACGKMLPRDSAHFWRDQCRKDGFCSTCKACAGKRARERRTRCKR